MLGIPDFTWLIKSLIHHELRFTKKQINTVNNISEKLIKQYNYLRYIANCIKHGNISCFVAWQLLKA